MEFRAITEIFPKNYRNVPAESKMLKVIDSHLEPTKLIKTSKIYSWINDIHCPYCREAYVTLLDQRIITLSDDEVNPFFCPEFIYTYEITPALEDIVRRAQIEQETVEMVGEEHAEQLTGVSPLRSQSPQQHDGNLAPRVRELEQRTDQQEERSDQLEQKLDALAEKFAKALPAGRQATEPSAPRCIYIAEKCARPAEEIMEELRQASVKPKKLALYVVRAVKIGYLNLMGHSDKAVYDTLQELFHFTWSYKSWSRALREARQII